MISTATSFTQTFKGWKNFSPDFRGKTLEELFSMHALPSDKQFLSSVVLVRQHLSPFSFSREALLNIPTNYTYRGLTIGLAEDKHLPVFMAPQNHNL